MQSPKDGYEYVVSKGNNRLKVYKDLHKDHSEKKDYTLGKWKRIPCEVYENYDPDVYHEIQLTFACYNEKNPGNLMPVVNIFISYKCLVKLRINLLLYAEVQEEKRHTT